MDEKKAFDDMLAEIAEDDSSEDERANNSRSFRKGEDKSTFRNVTVKDSSRAGKSMRLCLSLFF